MIGLIIAAGGKSTRMKSGNKLLLELRGKSVLHFTIEKFLNFKEIQKIVVVTPEEVFKSLNIKDSRIIRANPGKTRKESVLSGLEFFNEKDFVMVHDGARPFIHNETIESCIRLATDKQAFFVGVKCINSMKKKEDGKLISVDRNLFVEVQTPQGASFNDLKKALSFDGEFTDESSALERQGVYSKMIEGTLDNVKITTDAHRRLLD